MTLEASVEGAPRTSPLSDEQVADEQVADEQVADEQRAKACRAELDEVLGRLGRVVVAFSGGADSAFLAAAATERLGRGAVLCATAVSASLALEEQADCQALAAEWGLRHVLVATDELDRDAYVANQLDRCAHCKTALMEALVPLAEAEQATVVLGVNLDDLGEYRPGQEAASAKGAAFPLVEAGFTKSLVRVASRLSGLRTWDKPAAACLASRVPHGMPVTLGTLSQVSRAESGLRALGFAQLRVRHHGDTARLEIALEDMARLLDQREAVAARLHQAGYRYATLDLDGFRSGNLARSALEDGALEDGALGSTRRETGER